MKSVINLCGLGSNVVFIGVLAIVLAACARKPPPAAPASGHVAPWEENAQDQRTHDQKQIDAARQGVH